ncbi:hypothetical protein Clacol_009551 [Clathrus columnatus]|uniref:Arf-GAP domain-containing protein n=1 Tax=Clathrus columnatus TaxID=1419009 RepID=A0AAV5AR66_9AGAM|nr:hypothetical protein Clacol_009551 [Clathrus columnatus]
MGVHVSFVRSTNLDSWQLTQLRTMKVGGNQAAKDFFTRHGGATIMNDPDSKKKYTHRVADMYKEELAKRVKEDTIRYPNGIYLEGMEVTTSPTVVEDKGDDDDFFSSWDKPKPSPKAPTAKPSPPSIGRAVQSESLLSTPSTASMSSAAVKSTPSTGLRSKLGATRAGSIATSTPSSRPAKLGAKKAATPINFAEAERKAREEEERIKQLGYDRKKEEEEEAARKQAAEQEASMQLGKLAPGVSSPPASIGVNGSKVVNSASKHKPHNSQDLARLGMGMNRLGFGATAPSASSSSKTTKSTPAQDDSTYARETFGSQKAISSDMYFKRDAYDPEVVSEAQSRLQSFQGATSISSNQYFGREEESDFDIQGAPLLSEPGSNLASVESAARELVGRVLSNPDVQNVGESLRNGALKLCCIAPCVE